MRCLYCRAKIGAFRSVVDTEFCCSEHRTKSTTRSARVLRDTENLAAFDEPWYDDRIRLPAEKDGGHRILILLALAVMVLGALGIFVSRGGVEASEKQDSAQIQFGGGTLASLFRGKEAVTVRQEFSQGAVALRDWKDYRPGPAWSHEGGSVRPARLRIWTPSETLTNYDFEFSGQIERKSLDWAFRAADGRNYYASKLAMAKPNNGSNATLIRYVVLDGKAIDHAELPLSITLGRNTDYRVHMSVRGHQFLTSIDGSVVSTWTDNRISRGGVGLFSDPGESSLVKWVSLAERDSVVGRVLAHFSLFILPQTTVE